MHDELTRIRRRLDDLDAALAKPPSTAFGGDAIVILQTAVKSSYPTEILAYYYCNIMRVTGPETEGASGIITTTGTSVMALHVGQIHPPQGTNVIGTMIAGRWTFRYDG